jgi:Fe-S cluster assembly iron-binding protein IscA
LDTSFTGEDRLRTRLQARDLPDFSSDPIGRSFAGGGGGNFVLDDLVYTFPLGPAEIILGANSIGCDDFVASTISPLDSSSSGSISNFGFPGQYGIACDGDAGMGAVVQIADGLSLDFGYSAAEASDPSEGAGLFNGDYSGIVQLTSLDTFGFMDLGLTYVHSYAGGGFFFDNPEVANTYGAQVNFKINDTIELGGGYAYVDIEGIDAAPGSEHDTWQATLAFNDLVVEGSQLGFLIGQPRFEDDIEEDASLLAELYYNLPITDGIAITPSIIWINDPFNNDVFDDTWMGNLRTTFSF